MRFFSLLMLLVGNAAHAALGPDQLGIVINTDDPTSEATAALYQATRQIPASHIVRVRLGNETVTGQAALNTARAVIATLPATVQVLALTFRYPSQVDGSNSITSAVTFGFYQRPASTNSAHAGYANPWWNSPHSEPFTKHRIRPSMQVTGGTPASTAALIQRGLGQMPKTVPARAMYTSDTTRSLRASRLTTPVQILNGVTLEVLKSNTVPAGLPIGLWFHGLSTIPELTLRTYLPGAWVDTLTSCSGMPNGCGGQVTVWQIIDAGVTGSHGTVEEPYALPSKFIDPVIFTRVYASGAPLIEAAWKALATPYQGLLVGDPLAAAYAPGTGVPRAPEGVTVK